MKAPIPDQEKMCQWSVAFLLLGSRNFQKSINIIPLLSRTTTPKNEHKYKEQKQPKMSRLSLEENGEGERGPGKERVWWYRGLFIVMQVQGGGWVGG